MVTSVSVKVVWSKDTLWYAIYQVVVVHAITLAQCRLSREDELMLNGM